MPVINTPRFLSFTFSFSSRCSDTTQWPSEETADVPRVFDLYLCLAFIQRSGGTRALLTLIIRSRRSSAAASCFSALKRHKRHRLRSDGRQTSRARRAEPERGDRKRVTLASDWGTKKSLIYLYGEETRPCTCTEPPGESRGTDGGTFRLCWWKWWSVERETERGKRL